MQRRTFISSVIAVSSIGLAGCSAPTPHGDSEPNTAKVLNHLFEKIKASETPSKPEIENTAQLSDGSTEITIRGTVTVPNGCTTIAVGVPPEFDGNVIEAMIGTRKTGGDMCTQALEDIGYELTITFSGEPDSIEISHAGESSGTHTLSLDES